MNELALALEREAVAGSIITPVHDVYRKARLLVEGEPRVTFGLDSLLPAALHEIVDGIGRLAGRPLPPEGGRAFERCWVEPASTAAQAGAAAERLGLACERAESVLFATGHPAGPIELYSILARAMAERGARIMRVGEGEPFEMGPRRGGYHLRYVGDVACLSGGGELLHTHSPRPMSYLLEVGPRPDLVVGDHGFAGLGLARGADAVAVVDTNDPALVLAWVRGLPVHPILCDDNRPPSSYLPLARFLVERLPAL